MSVIAELVELLIGPPTAELEKRECVDYVMHISDDLLRNLYAAYPWIPQRIIHELWQHGVRMLVDELKND